MNPQDIDYKQLAVALLQQQSGEGGVGTRFKAVGSTPTASYGHGPGGLFSSPGLSRPLFSAMLLPRVGLQSRLPVRGTNETNPLFGIITGVTATTGSEAEGVCSDPPTSGVTKLCTHSFVFGRYSRMTKVFDIDRAGRVINRGEFLDLQLMNNPFNEVPTPNNPSMAGFNPQQVAQNEVAKALFEFGVAWSRDFARLIYTGNPSNNTAGGGYKEFYGLQTLVNTGYQDAETGIACPAADSLIRSFGSLNIAANAASFVRNVTNMYRNLKFIANRTGLDPVQFVITMPFGMFYEVTEIWPISYMTYRAQGLVPTGSTNFVNSADIEKMRDDMRGDLMNYDGQYLLIDGQKVPVIVDDAITETAAGGGAFTSEMYILPMTVLGGQPSLYMEYFNYDISGGAIEMARQFAPADMFYTSDNGRFLWHKKPPTNFCVQVLAKTEPRLILLTPYIAARLTDIAYLPVEHERSPFTDSAYWKDGGKTQGDAYAPSYYPPVSQ
jgi:hypothetical protein